VKPPSFAGRCCGRWGAAFQPVDGRQFAVRIDEGQLLPVDQIPLAGRVAAARRADRFCPRTSASGLVVPRARISPSSKVPSPGTVDAALQNADWDWIDREYHAPGKLGECCSAVVYTRS